VEKSGGFMLMGEYHHNIDDKKRMIIPSKYRDDLGDKVIVTRGLEGCLVVYSETEWNRLVSKLKTLPFTKKDARSFVRFFLSGATECEFDKQGRIKISLPLAEYASLNKECVVIGVNDRLEIWSEDLWNKFMADNEQTLSDAAENLFDTNFDM
jgi:MraZ protein